METAMNMIQTNPAMNYATIAQTSRHTEKTSERYSFIPTSRVLTILADYGWHPASVQEALTRKYAGYQKHIVRLRQQHASGANIPEIVIINAHMGSAAFHLLLGIFRFLCLNGLISGETWESFKVRHVGYTDEMIEAAARALAGAAPKAMDQVRRFEGIELTYAERHAFGQAAVELVNDGEKFAMRPESLLAPRRVQDTRTDLWTTFNVIQENTMRGGVRRINADGGSARTRAVKSADQTVKLNQALWTLTEKMAELKLAA